MRILKSIVVATALTLAMGTAANAQRTDIVIGMVLEPPHLDPTAGAAARDQGNWLPETSSRASPA